MHRGLPPHKPTSPVPWVLLTLLVAGFLFVLIPDPYVAPTGLFLFILGALGLFLWLAGRSRPSGAKLLDEPCGWLEENEPRGLFEHDEE